MIMVDSVAENIVLRDLGYFMVNMKCSYQFEYVTIKMEQAR